MPSLLSDVKSMYAMISSVSRVQESLAVGELDRRAGHGHGLLQRLVVVIGLHRRVLDRHGHRQLGRVEGEQHGLELGSEGLPVDDAPLLALDDLDLGAVEHQAGVDGRHVDGLSDVRR